MAVQIGPRQWVVHAADLPFTLPGPGGTGGNMPTNVLANWNVKINQIEFEGYSSVSDNLEIQDQNGNDVWKTRGNGDLSTERTGRIGWVNGIKIVTLTSGSIYFYTD